MARMKGSAEIGQMWFYERTSRVALTLLLHTLLRNMGIFSAAFARDAEHAALTWSAQT